MTKLDDQIAEDRKELDHHPPGDTGRGKALFNLADSLEDRFLKKNVIGDLEEAIGLHRSALAVHPEAHPDRHKLLYWLAWCLGKRYRKQGTLLDLDEAITLGRAALDLRDEDHPDRSYSLHSLALCFSDRYNEQGSAEYLEEAITLGRAALELRPPGHSDRALTLYNLGYYLRSKFMRFGDTADLDEAISLHRSTLELQQAGRSDRLMSLNQLVNCLGLRFGELEEPANLDDLIFFNRAILELHPPGNKGRVEAIDELLRHLRKRGTTADWEECITLGRNALGLHKPRGSFHATCFRHLVSDLQSLLRNLENAFSNANNSSDHTMSLHNLVLCIRSVVTEGQVSTHVDEIVAIMRGALKLCPPDHSARIASSTTLTTCLQDRYKRCGQITDLDEAIILCREVLERYPSGSPDSAPPLHKLAWCLSQRFIRLSTSSDLEDAIEFEQAASTLYPPDHPDRAECLDSLSNYLQIKITGRDANSPPACPITQDASFQTRQLIRDVTFEFLNLSPSRLLYTHNGALCDRNSQMSYFEKSHQFNQLMLSYSTPDKFPSVTHIRAIASTYFRYVTLSHRWGNAEPLLRDIEGRAIYDLKPTGDGLSKLQSFCIASCRHGYLWAWSDTCCIDKESSAELQEAIGSMFSWYRRSALTIIHLADVSGTGTLTSSVWFKRGWTLQELLAPRFLLFFTQDWSLYRGISSNHKEDNTILGELEQATGITSRHLTDFCPSAEDARTRLQWASRRFTTRPEDISYSLLGVFGLHIPVLYGESVGNALGRLLAEVISKSGETSILDWVGQSSTFHSCFPATIAPYRTLPTQLPSPDLTTPPNIRFVILRSVRKMHKALSHLSFIRFINYKLILPCIVYHINAIALTCVDTNTATHVHRIEASGLEPIEIVLSQALENTSGTEVPYILIRPRHSNLLDASVMTDNASARRWLMRMQQPFSALLLQKLPHNMEYKRVASTCYILARPTDPTGVLKGKVTKLTII